MFYAGIPTKGWGVGWSGAGLIVGRPCISQFFENRQLSVCSFNIDASCALLKTGKAHRGQAWRDGKETNLHALAVGYMMDLRYANTPLGTD